MTTKLLDCTLRDGGNQNNWLFTPSQIHTIVHDLDQAKLDFIEIGYRGGSGSNKAKYVGDAALCSTAFLASLPPITHAELAMMVVPSVCPLSALDDLPDTPIHLIRLASYPHNFSLLFPYIKRIKQLGRKVSVNLMAVSYVDNDQLLRLAQESYQAGADIFYIADSFGALTPRNIYEKITLLTRAIHSPIGFHGHNNIGLAFANALSALDAGATYIDTSLCGMARGAGNLPTEQYIAALNAQQDIPNPYNVSQTLATAEYVRQHILSAPMPVSAKEIISGLCNLHYYYYDDLLETSRAYSLDHLVVGTALGLQHPSTVDHALIEHVCLHLINSPV